MRKVLRIEKPCHVCGKPTYHTETQIKANATGNFFCSKTCFYAHFPPKITLACLVCGKPRTVNQTQADNGLGKFCSVKCSRKYYNGSEPVTLICAQCQSPFQTMQGRVNKGQRYCSTDCAFASNRKRVINTCDNCKMPFEVKLCHSYKRFCSKKCSGNARRTNPILLCEVCGNQIERTARKGRFCSQKCMSIGTSKRVNANCEQCGKLVNIKRHRVGRFRFCSHTCSGINRKLNQKVAYTSIELAFMGELDKRKVKYESQYPYKYGIIDIAFPKQKIAIECDGDYWHTLPRQQAKDRRRDKYLTNHGWTVFRFWEHEINASVSECVDRLLAYVNFR